MVIEHMVGQHAVAHLVDAFASRAAAKFESANFSYRTCSRKKPRRVVAKLEWRPGELYPRVGFIVSRDSLRHPSGRAGIDSRFSSTYLCFIIFWE
jgi:hypothetical protein